MVPWKQYRYIFWQNIVSSHRVVLLETEAYSGDVDVVLVAVGAMSSDRGSSGWTARALYGVTTIVDPLRRDVCDLVQLDGSKGRTRENSCEEQGSRG